MKIKLISEPSIEFQKVTFEIEYEIQDTDNKEREIGKVQESVNDWALDMLKDLIMKKNKLIQELREKGD
jgi:hypothetical protein